MADPRSFARLPRASRTRLKPFEEMCVCSCCAFDSQSCTCREMTRGAESKRERERKVEKRDCIITRLAYDTPYLRVSPRTLCISLYVSFCAIVLSLYFSLDMNALQAYVYALLPVSSLHPLPLCSALRSFSFLVSRTHIPEMNSPVATRFLSLHSSLSFVIYLLFFLSLLFLKDFSCVATRRA